MGVAVSIPCGVCPAQIALGMTACPGCSRAVTAQDLAVLQVRLEGGNFQAHERGRQVRAGSKWIGALAILFAVAAPLNFAMQKTAADQALAGFDPPAERDDGASAAPSDSPPSDDEGPTRAMVTRVLYRNLVANLVLAGLMAVLWLWARRAPLPAIASALALYLVVQVVSAVWDPTTIYKGIFVKLLAIGALWKGLKAALDARAAMQRPGA
jgi:hypothetical protein